MFQICPKHMVIKKEQVMHHRNCDSPPPFYQIIQVENKTKMAHDIQVCEQRNKHITIN